MRPRVWQETCWELLDSSSSHTRLWETAEVKKIHRDRINFSQDPALTAIKTVIGVPCWERKSRASHPSNYANSPT